MNRYEVIGPKGVILASGLTKRQADTYCANCGGTVRAENPAPKRRKNPARADDIPGDFSQSSAKVYGRAWSDAESAKVTKHSDGETVVRLTFKDGEWLQMIFDTEAGAMKNLARLGFSKAK